MAGKSWIKVANEWHLWPGLAITVVAIISTVFFLLIGAFRERLCSVARVASGALRFAGLG